MTSFSDRMTFIERLINTLFDVPFIFLDVFMPTDKNRLPKHHLELTNSQIVSRADLCLTVRNNVIDFTRPMMPNVVSMSTEMARLARPLPGELETFMNASHRGVNSTINSELW